MDLTLSLTLMMALNTLGIVGALIKLHRTPPMRIEFVMYLALLCGFGFLMLGDIGTFTGSELVAFSYTPTRPAIYRSIINMGLWYVVVREHRQRKSDRHRLT